MLTPFVVPLSVVILTGLFLVQKRGTAAVGAMFGPVMVVWFITIGAIGLKWIARCAARARRGQSRIRGAVLRAEPLPRLRRARRGVPGGDRRRGAVCRHGPFRRGPIRVAWFSMVLPGLLLNYFGQGALLLTDPSAAESPFYRLVPLSMVVPFVVLATVAAVIASQALISAVFSLTRQAVQLGYSPRVEIRHTSATTIGQIYVPSVNWALAIATIALVIGFRSSSALAAAYGIAVTATMGITTILAYVVARQVWHWSRWTAGAVTAVFITIDLAFFGANLLKVLHGGWVPLVIATLVFSLLSTWKTGRMVLGTRLRERAYPFDLFLKDLNRDAAASRAGHGDLHDRQRRRRAAHAHPQPPPQQGAAREHRAADRHDRRRAARRRGNAPSNWSRSAPASSA